MHVPISIEYKLGTLPAQQEWKQCKLPKRQFIKNTNIPSRQECSSSNNKWPRPDWCFDSPSSYAWTRHELIFLTPIIHSSLLSSPLPRRWLPTLGDTITVHDLGEPSWQQHGIIRPMHSRLKIALFGSICNYSVCMSTDSSSMADRALIICKCSVIMMLPLFHAWF